MAMAAVQVHGMCACVTDRWVTSVEDRILFRLETTDRQFEKALLNVGNFFITT